MSEGPRRPFLPDVTLVAVTSVALQATLDALRTSMREVEFGEVLLFSDQPPRNDDPAIKWRQIGRLGSRADYSAFMLRSLGSHIRTKHALCIQWDGFVLDGTAWDPAFLDFDYIGAVWPHFHDGNNVGNGGFSLRSKRLLDACTQLATYPGEAEDVVISRLSRAHLEAQALRFAPESVARHFSYERTSPNGREFGFHGAFNLVRHLSPEMALRTFRSLEPGMLTTGEALEVLRWAILRGRVRLAAALLSRVMRSRP